MIYAFTLGLFAFSYLLSYLLRAVNAVVAPDLVRDIGLDASTLGVLTASYLFAFAAFQIPLGVLLDRYGPRRVQTSLLVIAAIGTFMFASANDAITLTLARGLIGLGFAGGLMAAFKAVVQFVPESRRALANACIMAFGGLGIVLATQPTEWAVSIFGWRAVFFGFSAIILAAGLAIFTLVKDGPKSDKTVGVPEQLRGVKLVFSNGLFWRIAPVGMLTAGGHLGIQTLWAGPWFRDVAGFDRSEVASSLFLMGLAFLVGVLASGAAADWLARRGISLLTTMAVLMALMIVVEIPLMMAWTDLAMPCWIIFAMTGQATILAYPWLSSHFGAALSGRTNTAINLLIFAFAFITQTVIGWIIDLYPVGPSGGYSPDAYQLSFQILIGAQILAFLWFILGRKALADT